MAKTDISFLRCFGPFEVWNSFLQNALLVTVVIDGFACIFLISAVTYFTKDVSRIDIDSRGAGVLPCLRLAVVPLLLPSSLLVRGFAGK